MKIIKNISILCSGAMLLFSCNHNFDHIPMHESPRWEYAPNMYASEAYEPVTQVVDSVAYPEEYNTMPGNNGMNLRLPVANTVKRTNVADSLVSAFLPYTLPKDSLAFAGKTVKSPLTVSDAVLKDGEVLYNRYCSHCHGTSGAGDGPVSEKFAGIANLTGAALKTVSEGHIFHVITHGKGRMLSHASQTTMEERWKIAHYIKESLQKSE